MKALTEIASHIISEWPKYLAVFAAGFAIGFCHGHDRPGMRYPAGNVIISGPDIRVTIEGGTNQAGQGTDTVGRAEEH